MFAYLHWDPDPIVFKIPFLGWSLHWYSVLFATSFWIGFLLFVNRLTLYFQMRPELALVGVDPKTWAKEIADRLTFWVVLATVVGARLGHFLLYESPSHYLDDPWAFFRTWEGGLASHGAAALLVLVLFWVAFRHPEWKLSGWKLLDLLAIPTPLAGVFIRCGNFINQEILGTPSRLPWAVIFEHPLDRSAAVPRHPVQLYEAIAYFAIFCILWRLSGKRRWMVAEGKLFGAFLLLVFGARLLLETWKVEQSALFTSSWTMGQLLSLPLISLGVWLLFRKGNGKS